MLYFSTLLSYAYGFDYYNSYTDYHNQNQNQNQNENVWKYTETTLVAPTIKTEAWQKNVNSNGITNWDDHLRSQGIDPAEHQKSINEGTEKNQWYNPMLECKQGHSFNGDTAPTPDMKMKYMATPSYPSRTMGVFKCKWTIQRGGAPLIKLVFSMIDFECNGLNPTVQSWGTANHIQITDRGNVKSIYCGKKAEPPFYTDSKEIQVEIQVNTAGFGKRGSRIQIIYQSVKARGVPRTSPKPRVIAQVPRTTQIPGGYTLPTIGPQIQNERTLAPRQVQGSQNNYVPPNQVNPYHRPGFNEVNTQMPYHSNQGEHFPHEFNPPADNTVSPSNETETAPSHSTSMIKSTIGLAVGGVIVLIVVGTALFVARAMKKKISNWKRPASPESNNVITFVNELVSSNVKTVSEEPLNQNTLQGNTLPRSSGKQLHVADAKS